MAVLVEVTVDRGVDGGKFLKGHHAVVVRQWLARSARRIKLIFLLAYAPHFNAIERLWGVPHRELTHIRFDESFDLFARAIDDFFRRRLPQEWRSSRDTITDKFRVLSHQDFRILG